MEHRSGHQLDGRCANISWFNVGTCSLQFCATKFNLQQYLSVDALGSVRTGKSNYNTFAFNSRICGEFSTLVICTVELESNVSGIVEDRRK